MKETKNARFRRVAEARVNKIIRMLRLLGNCSGTNTYAYDADAVEQIFTALQIELDQARKRFSENGRTGRNRFSLSQAPTPDTVSYPHITLPLPDGTHLRAVAYADTTYPAINLYLLRDGEPEELVCRASCSGGRYPAKLYFPHSRGMEWQRKESRRIAFLAGDRCDNRSYPARYLPHRISRPVCRAVWRR